MAVPVPAAPLKEPDTEWPTTRAEVQALLARGEAIQAVKTTMMAMRAFAERHEVHAIGVDAGSFYSEPLAFSRSLKAAAAAGHVAPAAVGRLGELLGERGLGFLALNQPARAHQDLEASAELFAPASLEPRLAEALARVRSEVSAAEAATRAQAERRRVPVSILTGFLGAGKTTLLNYILRARHGKRIAVIENEVGQIGIDNQLIAQGGATRTAETIAVLDNGCLCCTVRSDLIGAIRQILSRADMEAANAQAQAAGTTAGGSDEDDRPPLDGILIETTGLADPGPVCKTFYAEEELRIRTRLDGVLTVVDARHFLVQIQRRRSEGAVNESAQQVGFADRVLLNKVDAVDAGALRAVEDEIRKLNQACPIFRCSLAQRPEELPLDQLLCAESFSLDRVLQDVGDEEAGGASPSVPPAAKRPRRPDPGAGGRAHTPFCAPFKPSSRHDTGVGTFAVSVEGAPMILERFTEVMNSLRAECAVDLYRYKGVVCIKEPSGARKRAVLQGVHDMCELEPRGPWPDDMRSCSQMVFIGRNLDQALWTRLFEKCKEGVLE